MDFKSSPDDQYLHLQDQKLMKREPMSPISNSNKNDFMEFASSPLKTSYSCSFVDTIDSDWVSDSKLILNHDSPDYLCDFWEDDFLYLNEFTPADNSTSQVIQNNLEIFENTEQVVAAAADKNKKTKGLGKADGTKKKQRKSYSKNGSSSVLNIDEIQKYFDMPISMAAKKMNIGLTVLKKRCRELNIMRWPHRKIMSLKSLINNVKELGMAKEVEKLEDHKTIVEKMPQVELTEKMKKLRQACFKAKYKKKKQMRAASVSVSAASGSFHLRK